MRRLVWRGLRVNRPTRSSTLGRALLFSLACIAVACGSTADSYLNDTWTWDGADWHKASSSEGPSWRFGALYVYDEATGEIVLFGGEDAAGKLLSETWTWDGHWKLRHPAVSPPARMWPAAAYDPIRNDVIMFGGNIGKGQAGDIGDTWTWDGQTWSQNSFRQGREPPGQSFGPAAAAFDPASKQVVLVNGPTCIVKPGEGCSPDTWSWDGKTWTVHPSSAVMAVTRSGFLYTDTKLGRLVMLDGGFWTLSGVSRVWDGVNWSALSAPPFKQVTVAGLAYDDGAASLVAFGGDRCNTAYTTTPSPTANTSETMVFDGTAWSQLQPVNRPPARDETYLAYDSKRRQIVMFGGWVQGQCSGGGALP
jgi:hypothetical protein